MYRHSAWFPLNKKEVALWYVYIDRGYLQVCVICISNGLNWSLLMHRDIEVAL